MDFLNTPNSGYLKDIEDENHYIPPDPYHVWEKKSYLWFRLLFIKYE